ncbi:MAG: LLM class flavin-dependent oxidoreductase [Acidimicrobiaceae bacterium]|nr:LLM class flavin-dependent oxidoreductase [Acidimicrobiaceae bacterium]
MKFQLAINLERLDDSLDMDDVARHTLEMVQMAEAGGFTVAWAAEHHALEMTIAPNPLQILTWWAGHTDRIRLGTAVAVAAYWSPIKLAGEAAFLDLVSGGRLEFGIGSGAYQREFDRMHPGLKQSDAWRYMQEMLPVLKELWTGDYAHDGEFWSFPTSTSVPKPVQKPHPPIWVAARSPITFDYAVANGCNVMSWPIARPFAEAELYRQQFDDSVAAHPGAATPTWALMRHTAVYDSPDEWMVPVEAAQRQLSQFENLFKNLGDVHEGFPKAIPMDQVANAADYEPTTLSQNLVFGTPEEVIAKLKRYEALGVDEFIYYASLGLGHAEQKRSMQLFCDEVVPAFA